MDGIKWFHFNDDIKTLLCRKPIDFTNDTNIKMLLSSNDAKIKKTSDSNDTEIKKTSDSNDTEPKEKSDSDIDIDELYD